MLTRLDERSDAELIGAAKAGDPAAFGALVARHQRSAVRIAAVALGSADGADEVAQDAFVKAHRALGLFRTGAPFEPWLFRIVTNTARNLLRRERRQAGLALRSAQLATVDELAPDEIASHRADRTRLLEAINRLNADDRLILTYRWYHELGEAEIARALGCPRGTVKSRLSRALSRLRNELDTELEMS